MKNLKNNIEVFIKKNKISIFLVGLFFSFVFILNMIGIDNFENKETWKIVEKTSRYLFTLIFTWFIFVLLEHLLEKIINLKIGKRKNAKTTFRALDTVIKVILIIIVILYSLEFWGVDITKIIAAGGIVGLAIGLAAKDFISNILGGIVVYLDRPFSEGEWISSPDRKIEGTVKKIKLRITEIETFDKRPLYVPNSTFLNIVIENPDRMKNRRICEEFSLRYKDSSQIKKIVYEIEKYLKENPAIETEAIIMVNFIRFAESSLDCQVYCFTKTVSWKLYMEIRQEIMLKIIDIVKKNKADMAFPTRTLEIDKENKKELENNQREEKKL